MGFRDPYVIEAGGGDRDWRIVVGSGFAGAGGALLVYTSPELTSGARQATDPVWWSLTRSVDDTFSRLIPEQRQRQMFVARRVEV